MIAIKFRAWNKKHNKWLDSNCGYFAVTFDGDIIFIDTKNGGAVEYVSKEDIELMQYTEVPDINGTEMHDGYRVKLYDC